MKTKKLNDVYMREVLIKDIKTIKNEELNSYITFKHVIKISSKCMNYINGKKVVIVDDGYTILEYSPIDKYYNVRVFIDDKGNIIKYYFDVILKNEFKDGEIFYDDLYLDVIYDTKFSNGKCDYISLSDENELIEALNKENITKDEFDFAYKIAQEIMDELLEESNIFVNRGIKDYKLFIRN